MDEHVRGVRPSYRPKITPSGNRPGVMSVKFPPRRVFVTGGASGIGASIVKAFCDAGCRVAFCDIDVKGGNATAQRTGSQFHPVDVADAAALEACMDRLLSSWGDIDVVVNNVGVSRFTPLTVYWPSICARSLSHRVSWPSTAPRRAQAQVRPTGVSSTSAPRAICRANLPPRPIPHPRAE